MLGFLVELVRHQRSVKAGVANVILSFGILALFIVMILRVAFVVSSALFLAVLAVIEVIVCMVIVYLSTRGVKAVMDKVSEVDVERTEEG